MIRKHFALICLFSGLTASPALAQVMRVDTSRTIIQDQYGNVIGSSFSLKIEGAFNSRMEQLRNAKIACFTTIIKLTSAESEKFWPLYNDFFQKKDELVNTRMQLLQQESDYAIETASEKEIKTFLNSYVQSMQDENALNVDFHKKLSAILPPKKVVRYYQAEQQFKQILLQTISSKGR